MFDWLRKSDTQRQARPVGYFLHLPKCAGTAVIEALGRLPRADWRILSDTPQSKQQASEALANHLKNPSVARRLQLVMGHDVHFDLGKLTELESRPTFFFTFLRDPVERYVSHYRYLVQSADDPSHPLHQFATTQVGPGPPWVTLEDFVEARRLPDVMAQYLGNAADGQPAAKRWTHYGEKLWHHVEHAIDRLDYVGFQETIQRDLPNLCRRFDLPATVPRTNVTSGMKPALNPRLIQKIQDLNSLDVRLYQTLWRLRES